MQSSGGRVGGGGVLEVVTIGSGQRRGCGGGCGLCGRNNRKWPATWLWWWLWFVRK